MPNSMKRTFLFFLLITVILAWVYSQSIHFQFTHLDDYEQVVENKTIQSIDFAHLNAIFSSTSVGMYQPLTTWIYAIVYSIFQLNPLGYHLASLLFHLLNTVLVYLLLKEFKIEQFLNYFLVSLFAFHPLQVESVVWISAFSNLVFTSFFLTALLSYFKYQKTHKKQFYFLSLLLFTLSCFSKSSAVVFPILILAIDFIQSKGFNFKNILNKVPFFFVSLIFGIITLYSRENAGHLSDLSVQFSFFDRIFLSAYSLLFYPFKFLVPFELSAFYPYPGLSDGFLPFQFYLSFPVLILLAYLIWKKGNVLLYTGVLFYIISILLVIQLIPVGNQLTTDRYSYLPLIGLLLILASFLQDAFKRKKALYFLFAIPLFLSFLSHKRTAVWENDQSIWQDVLSKHPKVAQAHNNLGSALLEEGAINRALTHFNQAIALKPYYADAYVNRGSLLAMKGESAKAIENYSKAIELKPHANAYFNRANEFTKIKDFQKALLDYSESIRIEPSADAFTNRAYLYVQEKDFANAHQDLEKAMRIDENYDQAYFVLGIVLHQERKIQAACQAFKKAVNLGNENAKMAVNQFCK
tara:strand:+ start:15600 stop:17339 length:1740 start_codon:yes stop_codon:yes gene_type:complete